MNIPEIVCGSLTKHGYKAMGAYPYDMFPFTKHAENIVLLVKQN